MFTFFLKRGFVNDVFFALGQCFDEASAGKTMFQGYAINSREPYMQSLARWLAEEGTKLDAEVYGSPAEVGWAIHRCRVWVGVHLAKEAYQYGASEMPKHIVKKFWKPANEVSDHYFINLRERRSEPLLRSVEENLMTALENAF